MKKLIVACAIATTALGAHAGEGYGGIGTLGLNVGYGQQLGVGVGRIELNAFNYGKDYSSDGNTYDAKLKLLSVGALFDYFPFQGGFRVTGGLLIGDNKLAGTATNNGTFTINGKTVTAVGESLALSVKWPTVMPYLGIGWGHNVESKGLGFYADGGIAFGKPKFDLVATPGLVAATPGGQSDIDAERQKIQSDLDKFKVYPVVKLGLTYNF